MKTRLISLLVALCLAINILPMAITGAGETAVNNTESTSGVILNKSLIPATDTSPKKIRIEAYVNGTVSTSEKHKPADIVLVLDQSGSMADKVNNTSKLELLKTAAQSFVDEVAKMNDSTGNLYRVAIVGFASQSGYGNNTEILTLNNGSGKAYNNLTDQDYRNSLVNCTASAIGNNGIIAKAIGNLAASGATRADLGMEMAADIFGKQAAGTYTDRAKIAVLITDGEPTTQSSFSSTVANAAVSAAKGLKDGGAHVFSMYIGTPSQSSANFLQAVSSNYPDATAYNNRGTQAYTTYYSAHSDGADIENMLTTVVDSISAMAALNEKSIVTGTISNYYMLAADVNTTGLDQVEIYVSDKTSVGWADEVPYDEATVSFVGEGSKTIGVSGFNFAANCVTEEPRNGSFYGRKLVIYIPIVEDESSDIFGGYVPASTDASIYQDETALENGEKTASAEGLRADYTLSYVINAAERAFHVDGTLLADPASKTVNFIGENEIASSVFDEMIPELPDYFRNIGVDITYKLIDIGTTDINANDRNDDVVVATLTVNAADGVDVTDPTLWAWTEGEESITMTIPAGEYFTEKVYVVVATLTSIRDVNQPETLTVYNYLDLSVVRGDLAHIVYGVIDANGKTAVPSGALGSLVGNTYTEAVTEGQDSATMIFAPNEGFKIKEIFVFTSESTPFDTKHVVYSTDPAVTVVKLDLDGDGIPDEVTLAPDGSWSFGAKNVTSGIAVEVYTEAITHVLTTKADEGSEIIVGFTYNYDPIENINVPFHALNGYRLDTVEVNGTVYDLTKASDREMLENLYDALFVTELDPEGNTIVVGGDVHLPATRDNDVKVTSARREYTVYTKYHIENADGTITEYTEMATLPVSLEFGKVVTDNVTFQYVEGDIIVIGGAKYVLRGWYFGHVGNGFADTIEDDYTMPAHDITLNAVWVKIPTYTVKGTIDENGSVTVPGSLGSDSYTETVTENENSAEMTFTANEGHDIEEIYVTVNGEKNLVFITDSEATVVNIDLDGDGNEDELSLAQGGSWSFSARNVVSDVTVEVYTKPVSKTLTTASDAGSTISDGYSYEYSTVNNVDVTFGVKSGYVLTVLEINGVKYDLTNGDDVDALTDLGAIFTKENNKIVSGALKLSATTDNDVKIFSEKDVYAVTIKYFVKNEDGTYTELTELQDSAIVEFGAVIMDNVTFGLEAGDELTVGEVKYIFENLYRGYEGDGYTAAVDGTETMPASNVTLNAVLTAAPVPPPEGGEQVNPETSDGTVTALLLGIAAVVGIAVIKKNRRIEDDE